MKAARNTAAITDDTRALFMHKTIEPSILYFGTPVTLISSRNEDQSLNNGAHVIRLVAGLELYDRPGCHFKTTENLRREGECVLNLPSFNEVTAINRIARTTGRSNVPHKRALGYSYLKIKSPLAKRERSNGRTLHRI